MVPRVLVFLMVFAVTARAALPMLSADGPLLVDPSGHAVTLRGCNLGNLLVLESWMFDGLLRVNRRPFKDQHEVYDTLDRRFDRATRERLIDAYRHSFVMPRDFEVIKSFGFNVVRLPFGWQDVLDDAGRPRADGCPALDRVLAMAEAAGVYVILDLHAAPGGQSTADHTGHADQNRLWQDKQLQDKLVAAWRVIAGRYRDRSVVAAYDLLNEPYADFKSDVRQTLKTLMPRVARTIRDAGDRHVVFFPGALNRGIAFYDDAKAGRLSNVGFTEHYYPGLFGSPPTLESHAHLLNARLPAKKQQLDRLAMPYLVGEFNAVLPAVRPDATNRAAFDRFAGYGWAATVWSYKRLRADGREREPGGWAMATNADPLKPIDLATATERDIESWFIALATMPQAVNNGLRTAMTTTTPPAVPLKPFEPLPGAAPAGSSMQPPGYVSLDIGDAMTGHTRRMPDGAIELHAGGSDIFAAADGFRFVARPARGPAELTATVTTFVDTDRYAKAGVMARWSRSADAAMAMVHVFPDGGVALITRGKRAERAVEKRLPTTVKLPVRLRLRIDNGRATAWYRTDGDWLPAGDAAVPQGEFEIGFAACAHADEVFTRVRARFDD